MKIKNLILASLTLVFFGNSMFSQNNYEGTTLTINYEPTGEVINEVDTLYTISCIIDLKSSAHLENIYASVGTQENEPDVFDYTFSYKHSMDLPEGITYNRQGNTVTIGFGDFVISDYFYKIKLLKSTNEVILELTSN